MNRPSLRERAKDGLRRAHRWLGRRHRAARWIGTAVFGFLSLWFACWLAFGDTIVIVRWGAYCEPWLGVLALLTAVFLSFGRAPKSAALAVMLGLLILVPVLPRYNPYRWFGPHRAADVRVVTFNVSALNADYPAIASLLATTHADIIFLQQVNDMSALRSSMAGIAGVPRYHVLSSTEQDTIILSHFALTGGRWSYHEQTAIVVVGRCKIRLWNFHAPHGQYAVGEQSQFFAKAAAAVSEDSLPVLAGGDLNSTEFNSVQAPLRSQLRDAFADAGAGLGFTFPSRVRRLGFLGTLFRIDHILYRGALQPLFAEVLHDAGGSDHFPVLAGFALPATCR